MDFKLFIHLNQWYIIYYVDTQINVIETLILFLMPCSVEHS